MLLKLIIDHASKLQKLVQFRALESLSAAIDAAAKRNCQSKSEYVRRSLIERAAGWWHRSCEHSGGPQAKPHCHPHTLGTVYAIAPIKG